MPSVAGDLMRFCVILGTLLLIGLLPSASACLSYAYTVDAQTGHRSLLTSDAIHFGTQLTVITDCPSGVTLFRDGEALLTTQNRSFITLDPGLHNLSLEDDRGRTDFVNARLTSDQWLWDAIVQDPEFKGFYGNAFSDSELTWKEVTIAAGTFLILYAAVIGYHWRVISEQVDTELFMEVR